MKIALIIIGIIVIGAAVLFNQKTINAPSSAPSSETINLNNELNNLDSQDLNSMDNELNQVDSDSSTF